MDVPIFKQFHKFIIGKGGANIKKIRDETNTKIDLPAEGDQNENIVITGKKENVIEARERIQKIQNELADIVSEEIVIPPKFYNSIIGAGGKLISSIMEECGGVTIKFPSPESKSDKVTIRGPKEDVEKAKAQLIELSNERELSSFSAEVRAKQQHHKFLIGKNGASIRKIRDSTGARIVFPGNNDEDKEVITILGKKESVEAARIQLEAVIKDIDNITEGEMTVEPKYHKHFVARRGEVLHRIAEECGGVSISFPRPGTDSDRVTLKGAKDCIDAAIQRILEIVTDLENMVTIECVISQRHHRTVMGPKGFKVQGVTSEFDVQIKFPDREIIDETTEMNGEGGGGRGNVVDAVDAVEVNGEPIRLCDIIRITGKKENCESAKQALLNLVPVTEEIQVAFDLHRSIIGQRGKDVRELMNKFDVHIELSPPADHLDTIRVSGTPTNVEAAKIAIAERVAELELDRADRELRSYELKIEIDPEFHPKIIGRKGAVINKIRADHGVQISFPKREDSEDQNIITIQGYEAATQTARDDIMKIVNELNDLVKEVISIDSRVHPRLIGQRGRSIHQIMSDYKVEIKFPRQGDSDLNAVTISGAEENVMEAKDHLLNLEEEYLQDCTDSAPSQTSAFSNVLEEAFSRGRGNNQNPTGFVVQGAPWEKPGKNKKSAPKPDSHEDFPDFGIGPAVVAEQHPISSAWGPRR